MTAECYCWRYYSTFKRAHQSLTNPPGSWSNSSWWSWPTPSMICSKGAWEVHIVEVYQVQLDCAINTGINNTRTAQLTPQVSCCPRLKELMCNVWVSPSIYSPCKGSIFVTNLLYVSCPSQPHQSDGTLASADHSSFHTTHSCTIAQPENRLEACK